MRTISAFAPGQADLGEQDIRLDPRGNLAVEVELEDVRQRWIERLRFWRGEWFRDVTEGTPYHGDLFGDDPQSAAMAGAVLTSIGLSVDGVNSISNARTSIDPSNRRLTYSAVGHTGYGDMQIDLEL